MDKKEKKTRPEESKKTYFAPQLKVHGNIKEITKNVGNKATDNIFGSHRGEGPGPPPRT